MGFGQMILWNEARGIGILNRVPGETKIPCTRFFLGKTRDCRCTTCAHSIDGQQLDIHKIDVSA